MRTTATVCRFIFQVTNSSPTLKLVEMTTRFASSHVSLAQLVDLLHLGPLIVLEGGHVIVILIVVNNVILIDAKPKLDHPVDATSEGGRLVKSEPRGEEGGVEQEPDEVLDSLVVLVLVGTSAESVDDGVRRVDLHRLLRCHVAGHGAVLEGLGLHDTLHVGGPAVLAGHQAAWGGAEAVGHDDLLGLIAKDLLDELAEPLAGGLLLLELLLLLLGLLEVETLLGHGLELLAIVLLELLGGVLVDGVNHEEHLEPALLELLDEGSGLDGLLGLTSDVVDVLLLLLHAGNVLLEGGHLLARLGGVEPEKLSELGAVLAVLVDAELEVLAELLVELVVVLGVLGDLVEHLDSLLDEVLLDDLEDLATLEHLTGDVEGKVLRVDDALDEGQVLRDEVVAGVGDEHTTHVQLDVGLLLGGLEHVEWGTLGHEEHSLELELALNREVLDGEVILPVVGDVLVEGGVLFFGDLLGVAHPEGLLLVHELPLVGDLLDGLLLLLLLLVLLVNLLNLGLLILIAILILVLILIVGDLLLGGLLNPEADGVVDELGVLLDELLDALLVEVLLLVVLKVEDDLGATGEVGSRVGHDGEGATSGGLPDVLLVVVVLGVHGHLIGDKEGGVETYTELPNHGHISTSLDSLHECLGAGLGDGTEVVHHIGLGHANAGVDEGQRVVALVGLDVDEEVLLRLELGSVGETLVADLVERI